MAEYLTGGIEIDDTSNHFTKEEYIKKCQEMFIKISEQLVKDSTYKKPFTCCDKTTHCEGTNCNWGIDRKTQKPCDICDGTGASPKGALDYERYGREVSWLSSEIGLLKHPEFIEPKQTTVKIPTITSETICNSIRNPKK